MLNMNHFYFENFMVYWDNLSINCFGIKEVETSTEWGSKISLA